MMFLVIAFHFSDHGATVISCSDALTINWGVLATPMIFGALCNGAFMLSSGYLLYQKQFRVRTVIKLWLQVWFYSIVIGVLCFIIGTEPIGIKSIVKMMLPFTFNEYWFFSTYIVVYLLFPFLNVLIDALNKKTHMVAIVIGLAIFCLLYSIPKVHWLDGANDIPIFIVLYFVGAYIKKYGMTVPRKTTVSISIGLIVMDILSVFFTRVIYKYTGIDNVQFFVWGTGKILPIMTSISLFLFFKDIEIKATKMISFISPSIFGVYLFHIGRLNIFLFKDLFNNAMTYKTNLLFPQMVLAMCSIFMAGILFDKIRILLFEKPVFSLIGKPVERLEKKLERYYPSPRKLG